MTPINKPPMASPSAPDNGTGEASAAVAGLAAKTGGGLAVAGSALGTTSDPGLVVVAVWSGFGESAGDAPTGPAGADDSAVDWLGLVVVGLVVGGVVDGWVDETAVVIGQGSGAGGSGSGPQSARAGPPDETSSNAAGNDTSTPAISTRPQLRRAVRRFTDAAINSDRRLAEVGLTQSALHRAHFLARSGRDYLALLQHVRPVRQVERQHVLFNDEHGHTR